MKVLWLCNQKIPVISCDLGLRASVFGGWLVDMSSRLVSNKDNSLVYLFPHNLEVSQSINNIIYYGFTEIDCYNLFCSILEKEHPDVIHIWGTEFYHSLQMIRACENLNYLDKTIISIQGLVSIYASHYCLGIPYKTVKHRTFHEIIRGGNIWDGQKNYYRRGKNEIEAIRKVKHIIGRTDFDRACTFQINPDAQYHICNETLRSAFYGAQWDINNIRRHSIFVSQCNYPIKGFHLLIKALSIIIRQYPDVQVYAAGTNPAQNAKDPFRAGTFGKYICNLIQEYQVDNHITFLGMLDEEKMYEQYRLANVFVSTSTIENSPNSVGEAMLVGCPVVASFVGGVQTLLEHGKDGFMYQADAPYMLAYYVGRIFEDDELAQKLSFNSRQRALVTHNPERNYSQLVTIYKKIYEAQ